MDSNNLGRYTVPTTPSEKAFFARHSGAITRYTISVVVIQAAWGFFSYNPAVALLRDGTLAIEWLSPYIPFVAAGILMILHKTLREETTEAFSNWVDKDELTINRWWNYAIPLIVAVGLFILDYKGVSTTLRDTSFEGKKTTATTQSDAALAKAKADYTMAINAINATKRDDEAAATAPFPAKFAQIAKMPNNDAQDANRRARERSRIQHEKDAALAAVRKEASDAAKEALATYNKEKTRITGIVDSTHKKLDGQDAANATNAENKGWYISSFFMILFLLMTYKLVVLRTKAGIRINVQFTALDATGSFIEKLMVVINNLLQRQGHRFLVFTHKLGSMGTAELRDFDGNVVLKQSSYNGSKITEQAPSVLDLSNDDLTGGTTQTPPPLPPAPPKNGNGGDDGNGGDRTTPPSVPIPSNSIAQPQTATASAVATLPTQKSLIAAQKDLGFKNPMLGTQADEVFKLATAYDNREKKNTKWNDDAEFIPTPTPSVVTENLASVMAFNKQLVDKVNEVLGLSAPFTDDKMFQLLNLAIKKGAKRYNDLSEVIKLEAFQFAINRDTKTWKTNFFQVLESRNPVIYGAFYNQVLLDAPTTPSVETPVTTVTTVTTPQPEITEEPVTKSVTVTTPVTTVTTTKTEESNAHGDRVLKDMKRGFQLEIGNIKSKNGTYETVMDRLIKKNREFDQAIRNREMKCSVKVVAEISEWVLDNVQPLITEYLKGNKEGSNE